jgi:hypothetical protein
MSGSANKLAPSNVKISTGANLLLFRKIFKHKRVRHGTSKNERRPATLFSVVLIISTPPFPIQLTHS